VLISCYPKIAATFFRVSFAARQVGGQNATAYRTPFLQTATILDA
jgi:hypothetical protein